MFNGSRPIDLRRMGAHCYRQSGCKTVVRCKLCNLYNITHDYVVISKCFTSSTFEK